MRAIEPSRRTRRRSVRAIERSVRLEARSVRAIDRSARMERRLARAIELARRPSGSNAPTVAPPIFEIDIQQGQEMPSRTIGG